MQRDEILCKIGITGALVGVGGVFIFLSLHVIVGAGEGGPIAASFTLIDTLGGPTGVVSVQMREDDDVDIRELHVVTREIIEEVPVRPADFILCSQCIVGFGSHSAVDEYVMPAGAD